MASVKNLKKDINQVLGDVLGTCYLWEQAHPEADKKASGKLMEETIALFDGLINKLHAKDVKDKKSHFKTIGKELEAKATALLEKIAKL